MSKEQGTTDFMTLLENRITWDLEAKHFLTLKLFKLLLVQNMIA